MSYKRLLIVFVSILFLQSCGLKFWYNRIDWLVLWQIDDYVELNSKQEDRLESIINKHVAWHRTTELPRYIALIEQLEVDFRQGTVEARYENYRDHLIDYYQTISNRIVDDLVNEIALLDDEQVTELINNTNEAAEKRFKKLKKRSKEDVLEDIEDNIADGYSDWAGRLNKSQKGLIKEWVAQIKATAELRYDSANQWRNAFSKALVSRGEEQIQKELKSLLTNPTQFQSEELQLKSKANDDLEKRYMMAIYHSLTEKQRKKFLRKLKGYKEDFNDLINDD